MGIKFLCPNGHKLHVKAFLSGKKAICPKCGARVVVPAESSPATVEPATSPVPVGGAAQSDAGETSTELALDESLVDGVMEGMSASDVVAGAKAPPSSSAPQPPSVVDAIEEAPDAVWYVRPAGGGQYGPASAHIMRNWLKEGRVGPNSLVWRAGWAEWRSGEAAFPELGKLAPTPASSPPPTATPAAATNGMPPLPSNLPMAHGVPIPPADAPGVQEASPLAQMARKRRRKNDVSLIASAILVGLSLILVIVLVLVFRGQGGTSEPSSEDSPAADELSLN